MALPGLMRGGGERGAIAVGVILVAFGALYFYLLQGLGAVHAAMGMLLVLAFSGTLLLIEVGLTAIIVSMLFSPEISLGQVAVRAVTLRLEDLLIVAVMFAWFASLAFRREKRHFKPGNLYLPLTLFLLLGLASTLRGASSGLIDMQSGLMYLLKMAEFFLIFLFTYQYLDSIEKIRKLLIVMLVLAAVLAVINLPKVYTTEVWTLNRISLPFEGDMPEPTTYGGYFIMVLGLLAALIHYAPRGPTRWLLLALFGVMLVPFIFTLSRTAYVSFIVALGALIVLTRNLRLLVLLLIVLILSPHIMPGRVVERVEYTFNDQVKVFGVFDRSFGERLMIWEKAWWNFRLRPVLGGGLTKDNVIDSYYARLVIELGVAGVLVFLWMIVCIFRTAYAAHRRSTIWWVKGVTLGYIVGLVGLLMHAFSSITFYIVRIMEPFWFVTGIVFAIGYLSLHAEGSSAETTVA